MKKNKNLISWSYLLEDVASLHVASKQGGGILPLEKEAKHLGVLTMA